MTGEASTKLVCTIGPACNSKETLCELLEAGMSVSPQTPANLGALGSWANHRKIAKFIETWIKLPMDPAPIGVIARAVQRSCAVGLQQAARTNAGPAAVHACRRNLAAALHTGPLPVGRLMP